MAIERREGDRPFLARPYAKGRRGPARAFHTRHEAEAYEAAFRASVISGAPMPREITEAQARPATVLDASRETIRAMLSGAYRTKRGTPYKRTSVDDIERRLRIYIVPRIGGMYLRDVDRGAVIRLREDLMNESPATARDCVDALRIVLRRSLERGEIPSNPAHGLPAMVVQRRKPRFLSREEALDLRQRADGHRNPRIGLFVDLALSTGARRGEIEALSWAMVKDRAIIVDGEAGNLTRRGILQSPKSESSARTIPVGERLWQRLEQRRGTGPVVGPIPDAAWAEVRPEGVTVHDLRHTAATFWLAAGMNVHEVAELLGHSDATLVLKLYGHALPSRMSIAGDVMEAFMSGGESGGEIAPPERPMMDDYA